MVLLPVLLLTLSGLAGQVPVHEEPLHQPVFQNKAIRILDVRIPPGDSSQYHIHTTPSLFIWFTTTKTGSQLLGGKASAAKPVAGTLLFENLAPPATRTHRVWNDDTAAFHVMDVELLFKHKGFTQHPLVSTALTLAIDTAWVRAYRLNLQNGKDFLLKNRKQPFILVSLNVSSVQTKQNRRSKYQALQAGSFIEINRKRSFSLRNLGDDTARLVLIELPVG